MFGLEYALQWIWKYVEFGLARVRQGSEQGRSKYCEGWGMSSNEVTRSRLVCRLETRLGGQKAQIVGFALGSS
jgi:hypothetical protein